MEINGSITEKTEELAKLLKQSSEYAEFAEAREAAFRKESTRLLFEDYRLLQTKVQAASLSGHPDDEELLRLQKLGELLQLDDAASRYLFAQFRLNALLADIYKKLAEAVDADLGMLDD
ncbi:MAG: YlbF family regulator [Clostridia bacterium]|nr:YlbF family regulator [Clostridia bacterium]